MATCDKVQHREKKVNSDDISKILEVQGPCDSEASFFKCEYCDCWKNWRIWDEQPKDISED